LQDEPNERTGRELSIEDAALHRMRALLGRMARLPFAMTGAALGMLEMATRWLEEVGRISLESIEVPSPMSRQGTLESTSTLPRSEGEWTKEERTKMADTNLNDDMVKLVEYSIVTIQREREALLEKGGQVIVADDLTGDAFSNARIADWVNTSEDERLKRIRDINEPKGAAKFKSVRDIDTDALRVYYNVLERWPKEDLTKDERQIAALEELPERLGAEIARALSKKAR
jgi:hypothetical protein